MKIALTPHSVSCKSQVPKNWRHHIGKPRINQQGAVPKNFVQRHPRLSAVALLSLLVGAIYGICNFVNEDEAVGATMVTGIKSINPQSNGEDTANFTQN